MPDTLPGWPVVLHEAWAAAYLSLSTTTFRAAVMPDVPPIRLTPGRIGWLRSDLDKWLAKRAPSASSLHNPWDDP